ncbi:hypothetical protein TNCV_1048201 [Trichonephila clavipes]|nr:hypothetical protein TNCV_1048201 [Trichonephila clavipes]
MKEGLIALNYECSKCNERMGLYERKSAVLDGDFEWVCSTITSQNIYGRTLMILLTMRPSRLFVKIRCHAVASSRKRSAVRNHVIPVATVKDVTKNVRYRAKKCYLRWRGMRLKSRLPVYVSSLSRDTGCDGDLSRLLLKPSWEIFGARMTFLFQPTQAENAIMQIRNVYVLEL